MASKFDLQRAWRCSKCLEKMVNYGYLKMVIYEWLFIDKKYFIVWMWTPREVLPPNSNYQPQERNHPGRKCLQYQKKLLHSLSAAVITSVQVYHETKTHIIAAVIMESRKAFVAQRWGENGCIQTELSISSRQTSLYSWVLKQALQLSGKL